MEREYSRYLKMFSILRETFEGTEKIKLFHAQSGEYLSVIPAYGGNLNEWVVSRNNQLHDCIAGDKTLDALSGKKNNAYRGAKLSPFPNRIKEGCYVFNNQRYHLSKNDNIHVLHGLIWNMPFVVIDEQTHTDFALLTIGLTYQNTHAGFPFHYRIEITYIFQQQQFSCRTKVINESHHDIPIGDGWHPYFTTGKSINELKLKLPSSKRIDTDESLIPTGRYVQDATYDQPTLIADVQLDHCFEIDQREGIVETILVNEQEQSTLVLWQRVGERGYCFVQLYTPPDRLSIAIEPMSCAPDAFNNKKGLIVLEPKESVTFEFGVRIE
ncbi:MAG: aldose 1-epimerase [Chitinophagaceae bacterium]|nr:aldose 1-epimerase [Chitinophagaceae bacterium]